MPIDELTSSKRDYQDRGKFANVVGRQTREQASLKAKRQAKVLLQSGGLSGTTPGVGKSKIGNKLTKGVGNKMSSGTSNSNTATSGLRSRTRMSGSSVSTSRRGTTNAAMTNNKDSSNTNIKPKSKSVMDERLKGNTVAGTDTVRSTRLNKRPSAVATALKGQILRPKTRSFNSNKPTERGSSFGTTSSTSKPRSYSSRTTTNNNSNRSNKENKKKY